MKDKKKLNTLCVSLTGRDYFYVNTAKTTVKDALEDLKKTLVAVGFDEASSHVIVRMASLSDPDSKVIDILKDVPAKPCVPVGNCQRCVNTYGTLGCWSTVSNIPQYNCGEGQRLFQEAENCKAASQRLDVSKASFDTYGKEEDGEDNIWFFYPKDYIKILEAHGFIFKYGDSDPEAVKTCVLQLTRTPDGTQTLEVSPVVGDEDVDYILLKEGVHYTAEDFAALLKKGLDRVIVADAMIDPAKASYDETYDSGSEKVFWFDYPKEYLSVLEEMGYRFNYDVYDPKDVVSVCIQITQAKDNGSFAVDVSPTVQDLGQTADVDYMHLTEGVHYTAETIAALLSSVSPLKIETNLASYDDYFEDAEGRKAWFEYPASYLDELLKQGFRFNYDGYDVECCSIRITQTFSNNSVIVEVSPVVSHDGAHELYFSYVPLTEGVHYTAEAVNALLEEAEKTKEG